MKFLVSTDWHLSSITPSSRIDNFTEAAFKKVDWVLNYCKENDMVLLLVGDLFNTPTQPDYIKNRLKEMILSYGVQVISIAGNHDLFYYNEDMLERTSLQAIVSPGVVTYLGKTNKVVKIGGTTIVAHVFGEEFPTGLDKDTIVLSHTFYNYGKEDKLSTTKVDVHKCGAGWCCFGHDHNRYELEQCGESIVVRTGALTRGTSHTENRVRKICVGVIDTVTRKTEYIDIPFVHEFKEVFREKYIVEREQKTVSFDEIQRFIESMRDAKMEISPFTILYSMGKDKYTTEKCVEYMNRAGLVNSLM